MQHFYLPFSKVGLKLSASSKRTTLTLMSVIRLFYNYKGEETSSIAKHKICGAVGYIIDSTLGNISNETHRWTSVYSHELVHCDDNV